MWPLFAARGTDTLIKPEAAATEHFTPPSVALVYLEKLESLLNTASRF